MRERRPFPQGPVRRGTGSLTAAAAGARPWRSSSGGRGRDDARNEVVVVKVVVVVVVVKSPNICSSKMLSKQIFPLIIPKTLLFYVTLNKVELVAGVAKLPRSPAPYSLRVCNYLPPPREILLCLVLLAKSGLSLKDYLVARLRDFQFSDTGCPLNLWPCDCTRSWGTCGMIYGFS